MAKLDPFSAQIVDMVRRMPDEAILALVRGQLGIEAGDTEPAIMPARSKARATRGATVKRKASAGRPKKRTTLERQKVLSAVERAVKAAKGLSASEVAKATGIGQVRVATALRELKLAKRIHQGGDRRFARYAGDRKTAEAASLHARKTASGPVLKKKPARKAKKSKKR
jgi:hypothetical protein